MNINDSNQDRYRFRLSLLHPRHWLTWFALGVFFVLTLLPMAVVDWLGCRLGNIAASKNKKRFNIVKTNLALCFADKDDAEIERMVVKNFQAQYRSLLGLFSSSERRYQKKALIRSRITSSRVKILLFYWHTVLVLILRAQRSRWIIQRVHLTRRYVTR
jgi:lauroyl/myristoyl acyltransferase